LQREGTRMHLSHPELDLWTIVIIVIPCLYYGIKHGISEGVKKRRRKVPVVLHPMRRSGDKYAWYFYRAYAFCGPDSFWFNLPWIGKIPVSTLAMLALMLVVRKGEQYQHARTNTAKTKVS